MSNDLYPRLTRTEPPIARPKPGPAPSFTSIGWLWICDAIEEIGKRLFPGEWTGEESGARALPDFQGEPTIWQRFDAGRVLNRTTHNPGPPRYEIVAATVEEYQKEQAAHRRFQAAANWLRQHAHAGELSVSYFLDHGACVVRSGAWFDDRFFRAAIRRGERPEGGHLFVQRTDLDRALAPASEATPKQAPRIAQMRRPGRRKSAQDRVAEAIQALYPQGIPAGEPVKVLQGRINEWLMEKGLPAASERTIRRARGGR